MQNINIQSFKTAMQEKMDEDSLQEPTTLPGFRFHPTEEELISFYLNRAAAGIKLPSEVIGFLNIYNYDPRELPGMAKINGEREWYFFVRRDKKKGHGGRPNRTTKHGFWKATGSDRQIRSSSETKKILGLKKTLVFYTGRAPRGSKTDWVMNEYRLPDCHPSPKEDVVVCKIYRKATSLKTIEQNAGMEDLNKPSMCPVLSSSSSYPSSQSRKSLEGSFEGSFGEPLQQSEGIMVNLPVPYKREEEEDNGFITNPSSSTVNKPGCLKYCNWKELGVLEVPKFSMDITTDSLWAQLRSPWLDYWSHGTIASLLQ